MNYFIKRDLQEYGPYSLGDLQRYVQQGNIALTDLGRSDGMSDWIPVSQIIGNVGVPAPASPYSAPAFGAVGSAPYGAPANPYGAQTPYGGAPGPYGGAPQQLPIGSLYPPPSLHWALVLLFSILSCWLFLPIWAFVQAAWVKKIRPASNAIYLLIGYVVFGFGVGVFASVAGNEPLSRGGQLVGVVCFLVAAFQMKSDIESYFNTEEPIGLQLSGVMTFFFAVFYFQYHFTRINEMKRMASLQYPGAYGTQ